MSNLSFNSLIQGFTISPNNKRKRSFGLIVVNRAGFIKIGVVIIVELVQIHVSEAFNHFFAFVGVFWVLQVAFDIVPLVKFGFCRFLHSEVVNSIPILTRVDGVEVRIGNSRYIVPGPAIRRSVRCAPKRFMNVSVNRWVVRGEGQRTSDFREWNRHSG